jgi:transposase
VLESALEGEITDHVGCDKYDAIAELKRRLAADSRNSSKPPSSDGLGRKSAPKSLRKAGGHKPGRTKGIRTR